MKITTIKAGVGSIMLAGILLASPISTYALSPTFINVNENGIVRIFGVEITGISGSTLSGILRFKNNTSTNVTINTTGTTTVKTDTSKNQSATTSLSSLAVGNIVALSGTLNSLGNPINVTASKLHNVTAIASIRTKSGTIQSINTSNNSFVILMKDNKTLTVYTNSATVFNLDKTVSTFPNTVLINKTVQVTGSESTDGTTLTASKVMVKNETKNNSEKKNKHHFGFGFGKWH